MHRAAIGDNSLRAQDEVVKFAGRPSAVAQQALLKASAGVKAAAFAAVAADGDNAGEGHASKASSSAAAAAASASAAAASAAFEAFYQKQMALLQVMHKYCFLPQTTIANAPISLYTYRQSTIARRV